MNGAVNPASASSCDWPVTNCYIDAWMLVLRDWGLDAMAGLGVTALVVAVIVALMRIDRTAPSAAFPELAGTT